MKRFAFAFFELPVPEPLTSAEDASPSAKPQAQPPAAESGVRLPEERNVRRAPTGTDS